MVTANLHSTEFPICSAPHYLEWSLIGHVRRTLFSNFHTLKMVTQVYLRTQMGMLYINTLFPMYGAGYNLSGILYQIYCRFTKKSMLITTECLCLKLFIKQNQVILKTYLKNT